MNTDKLIMPEVAHPTNLPGYFHPELHDLLDELASRKLIVISGPSRIGKSNLVATYIVTRNIQSIWYRVDKDDADLANFYSCMELALRKANPCKKLIKPRIALKAHRGIARFANIYFQEVYQHLETPFLMVFDNYQDVPEDAALHHVIAAACDNLPKGGRIVIITRAKCPPALAQLNATNMMAFIEAEDFQRSTLKIRP